MSMTQDEINVSLFDEVKRLQQENSLLKEREKLCETMDRAEKLALIRALQEIRDAAGLLGDGVSPSQIVEAVRELQRERERNAPFQPVRLIVSAEVRYWEDAKVNGVEDTDGTLIPFRDGDEWKPVIELATGRVIGWPEGATADIHYKVCDAGEYWLEAENGARMKWKGDYVPSRLLAYEDGEWGGDSDYIIFKVNASGCIENWYPVIDLSRWEAV